MVRITLGAAVTGQNSMGSRLEGSEFLLQQVGCVNSF